jgi:hypothetical protein
MTAQYSKLELKIHSLAELKEVCCIIYTKSDIDFI